jgi:hypothetical protein
MNDFAVAIDKIPKIVFSHTLKNTDLGWDSAKLATQSIEEEVLILPRRSKRHFCLQPEFNFTANET